MPIPTIVWNENRVMLIGGRSAGGTESSPWTTWFQEWKASSESRCGIPIPNEILPSWYQPSRCSGAPRVVLARPSSAASLIGCSVATSRATQSPMSTCSGEATAATVNGSVKAVRS